jgi:hypothetical protein
VLHVVAHLILILVEEACLVIVHKCSFMEIIVKDQ